MNKILLFTTLTIAVASCQKYEPSEPVSADKLKKATITGTVYADLDRTNADLEFAPEGTTLLFQTNYSNLISTATGEYVARAVVGANGHYSVEFPVADAGNLQVKITGNEFVYDVQKNSGTETKILELTNQNITVYPELSYVKNLTYADKETIATTDNWKDGSIEFTLRYPDSIGRTAFVPIGTLIRLTYNNVDSKTTYVETQVQASGKVKFTIKAPSVIDDGKVVTISSTAQLPYRSTVAGAEVTEERIFKINPAITATLYGDAQITLTNQTMVGPY
ncbi:MAG: hypothetical protein LBS01_07060 [Prevotellaceae bacterium]|jgi:hypothetical protein|nr:hypothetical protein [Prevotellaceae bacterium]